MFPLIQNAPPWPNGARCAVCIAFDFDAESLLHLDYPDDPVRQISVASVLRYGAHVAMPRILDIFRHLDIRQTFFVPGWCLENYPDITRRMVDEGHEIGHHGWLHERVNQLSRDDERRVLESGIEAIRAATGKAPTGYRAPSYSFSEHTLDLLTEYGFTYDASLAGDDAPYRLCGKNGSLLELPSDLSLDDWPQYVNFTLLKTEMTIRSPQEAMGVFMADFDAAWRHGGLFATIWHPFVSGRLARAEAIFHMIDHMKEKGGVWFARMDEIAAHLADLEANGLWTPRPQILPFWSAPVPQVARPSRRTS